VTSDRKWFLRHPDRAMRVREMIKREFGGGNVCDYVVVCRQDDDMRTRFGFSGVMPTNTDAAIAEAVGAIEIPVH
jgi:hypothetical protein